MEKLLPIYTRTVPLADTDMAGIVHFSRILCYAEEAEHDALRAIGVDVISTEGGFPKVHVSCDYRKPLRYGDAISVTLQLQKPRKKVLTWSFQIYRGDELVAEGTLITVFVNSEGQPTRIKPEVLEILEEYVS